MNHPILNLLILSLSFTVMLLTLAGFLLYRPRPRRAPHSAPDFPPAAGAAALLPAAPTSRVRRRPLTLGLGALLLALAAAYGLSNRAPSVPVRDFRELYQQGLLRSYEYTPTQLEAKEAALPEERQHIEVLAQGLRGLRISVLRLSGSPLGLSPFHDQALMRWRQFLRQHGLRSVEVLDALDMPADLIIVPQALALNDRQRASIETALARGVNVLATGPIGVLNGLGKPDLNAWSEQILGAKFAPNPQSGRNLPTIVASPAPSIGDMPPGVWFDWLPLDNSYLASPAAQVSSAPLLEADHQGTPLAAVRALRKESSDTTGRRAWSALDPAQWEDWTEVHRLRAEEMLLATLTWTARRPVARVATWKHGAQAALALSISADSDARALMRALAHRKQSATVILDPQAFKASDWERLKPKLRAQGLELAPRLDSPRSDDAAAFARLQTARLTLEELAQKRIEGARTALLGSAMQNRLGYVLADAPSTQASPVWIAQGRALAFAPTPASEKIEQDLARSENLGGALFVEVPAAQFKLYRAPLEAERLNTWRATLAEIAQWWQARRAVSATIEAANADRLEIRVQNHAAQPVEGLVIEIDPGTGSIWQAPTGTLIEPGHAIPIRLKLLTRLEGNESRLISLKRGKQGSF